MSTTPNADPNISGILVGGWENPTAEQKNESLSPSGIKRYDPKRYTMDIDEGGALPFAMYWLRRFTLTFLLASILPLQAAEKSITLAEIRAAKFDVTTLDGKVVSLDEILGQDRPVVLEFWATWCAPCRKTMPHLVELSGRHAGEDLLVLGLTVENPEKDMERVRQFVSKMGITYPIAFAPRELYRLVNDKEEIGVPKIVVFDRSGHVVEHVRTYSPFTNRRVGAAVGRAVRRSKER